MSWGASIHLFVIIILSIPYGVLVFHNRQQIRDILQFKKMEKLSKFTFTYFMLALFPLIGIYLSWFATTTKLDYRIIEDIIVNILGFSGLIFTFLLGNLLKTKSDLTKNVNDLELEKYVHIHRHSGSGMDTYNQKVIDYKNLLQKTDKQIKGVFFWGFLTILLMMFSLFGIILVPEGEKGNFPSNFLIFEFLFCGFITLLLTFDQFSLE